MQELPITLYHKCDIIRHKGDYGQAIDYASKGQRQVDDTKVQLDELNEKD